MKFILYVLLLNILTFSINAQNFHVRYNQAGYMNKAPKNFIINADYSLNGLKWEILKGDSSISNGQLQKSIAGKGDHTNFNFNYAVDFSAIEQSGGYDFKIDDQIHHFNIEKNPYATFLPDVLRYLRQQRSGSFGVVDKEPGHFSDSASTLYLQVKEKNQWYEHPQKKTANVIGGWYDAGDYLKFNLTNAYTTYLLLSAYEENPAVLQFKNESNSNLNDLLDEAKFGLDFLERCYVNDSTFVIQIGDNRDHELGIRLPSNDTNPYRHAYTSLSKPHLAYTSAAFSIASRVFKRIDSTLSKKYLKKSEALFKLALEYKEAYWFKKGHEVFYADKNGYDNLLLAAAELAKTTQNDFYVQKIKYYSSMAGVGYWASWSDFNMVAHARSSEFYPRSKQFLISDLNGFAGTAKQENNIWKIPHAYTWGSLYSFFGVAYASILHNDIVKDSAYLDMAYNVIDYTFGKNNWGVSFLASKQLPNSVQNIYSQTYYLQPELFPTGAIAEGPGDLEGHLENVKWFDLSKESYNLEIFNTKKVVFFDDATDFQTMETTIGGLADGIYLLTLISKLTD